MKVFIFFSLKNKQHVNQKNKLSTFQLFLHQKFRSNLNAWDEDAIPDLLEFILRSSASPFFFFFFNGR